MVEEEEDQCHSRILGSVASLGFRTLWLVWSISPWSHLQHLLWESQQDEELTAAVDPIGPTAGLCQGPAILCLAYPSPAHRALLMSGSPGGLPDTR